MIKRRELVQGAVLAPLLAKTSLVSASVSAFSGQTESPLRLESFAELKQANLIARGAAGSFHLDVDAVIEYAGKKRQSRLEQFTVCFSSPDGTAPDSGLYYVESQDSESRIAGQVYLDACENAVDGGRKLYRTSFCHLI